MARDSGKRVANLRRPQRYNRWLRHVFYMSSLSTLRMNRPNRRSAMVLGVWQLRHGNDHDDRPLIARVGLGGGNPYPIRRPALRRRSGGRRCVLHSTPRQSSLPGGG
ncbi:hypothetical protein [Micromonospora costi]|uniref:hypothetical protein n=1 Tax=Micromonospora costi TaxID=1530042 RepID=UPI001319E1BB